MECDAGYGAAICDLCCARICLLLLTCHKTAHPLCLWMVAWSVRFCDVVWTLSNDLRGMAHPGRPGVSPTGSCQVVILVLLLIWICAHLRTLVIKGMSCPARHRLFTHPPVAHDTGRDCRNNVSFMTAVTPYLTPRRLGKPFQPQFLFRMTGMGGSHRKMCKALNEVYLEGSHFCFRHRYWLVGSVCFTDRTAILHFCVQGGTGHQVSTGNQVKSLLWGGTDWS